MSIDSRVELRKPSLDRRDGDRKRQLDDLHARLHRAAAGIKADAQAVEGRLFQWATDTAVLRDAWDELSTLGGAAPGPDGNTYADLTGGEVWSYLRALSQLVRGGDYRPEPPRQVDVAKVPGDPAAGGRTLRLFNVGDRVLQKAALFVAAPLLKARIKGLRFGHGRGGSRMHALAAAERLAVEEDRWVWVTCDLADAFGSVPRQRLHQLLAGWLPDDAFAEHLLRLCGPGKRGVPQGAPMSSMLMEAYRHKHLDRPFHDKHPERPLLSYIDDLLILCRSGAEATDSLARIAELLQPAGMALNEAKTDVAHLGSGDRLDWLGYDVAKDGADGVSVRISDRAWGRLEVRLGLAHQTPNSPLYANALIEGWVDQIGPCFSFEDRENAYERIRQAAGRQAFREIPTYDAIRSRWNRSRQNWEAIRARQGHPLVNTPDTGVDFDMDATRDPDEAPFGGGLTAL